MQPGVARTVTLLVGVIALIIGLLFNRALQTPELSPEQLRRWHAYAFEQPRTLPDFNLVDHRGAPFTAEQLKGQWSLIFFGFTTCPDVCPTTMALLGKVAERFKDHPYQGKPVQYVMISVDPERDTPEQLTNYVNFYSPEFVGVTGEVDMIRALGLTLNIAFAKVPLGENGDYTMDHSAYIVVINPAGQYHGFLKAPHRVANIEQAFGAMMSAY